MENLETSRLSREKIFNALAALSERLAAQEAVGELCIFGGTAMMLAYNARITTKDVDAVFQPTALLRKAARQVGEELELPEAWLNDGVKGFVSERHETTAENLPQFANLRLTMPVPEYLLAMKCMASRLAMSEDESSDVADIILLTQHLKLTSAHEVLEIVGQFYPVDRIPVKTRYLVEGLFEEGLL